VCVCLSVTRFKNHSVSYYVVSLLFKLPKYNKNKSFFLTLETTSVSFGLSKECFKNWSGRGGKSFHSNDTLMSLFEQDWI
jgi:hypothetical protein